MRKTFAGLTAAGLICAAPAVVALASADAASAAKPAGTSYVATTTDGGVDIVTSSDRHQLRSALFAYKQTCSDGDTIYDYDRFGGIPISASGKFNFSYKSAPQASSTPGATYSYTQAISGVLSKSRTKIVGTARTTYTFSNPAGGSYTCDSGPVKFVAKD